MPEAAPCIIITGEDYRFLVAQQAKEAGVSIGPILLEPSARNTAPAIALAAFEALALHDSPKLLVQTADHYIKDLNAFGEVIGQALQSTAPFVLFGVKPTHPETGYGYIECGEAQGNEFLVSSFKEKPEGGLINGGYFVLSPKVFQFIEGDKTSWENGPLSTLADLNQLKAYKHPGFWQPMDTLREKNLLQELWNSGNAPWKIW